MTQRKFFDQSQPQTLQIAVVLLYLRGAFLLLQGSFLSGLGLVLMVGSVAGAFGIANEKKVGYMAGVAVAVINLGFLLQFGLDTAVRYLLIDLLFAVGLVALLLHQQSRDYQRIWFK